MLTAAASTLARDRAWLRKELTEQLPTIAALSGMFALALTAAWFLLPDKAMFSVLPRITLHSVLAACILLLPGAFLPAGPASARRTTALARLPHAVGSGMRAKLIALAIATIVASAAPTAIAAAMSLARTGAIADDSLTLYGGLLGAAAVLVWTFTAGCQLPTAMLALPCVATVFGIGLAGVVYLDSTPATYWVLRQTGAWNCAWFTLFGIGSASFVYRTAFGRERGWPTLATRHTTVYVLCLLPVWGLATWSSSSRSHADPSRSDFHVEGAIASEDGQRMFLTTRQGVLPFAGGRFPEATVSHTLELDLSTGVTTQRSHAFSSHYAPVSTLFRTQPAARLLFWWKPRAQRVVVQVDVEPNSPFEEESQRHRRLIDTQTGTVIADEWEDAEFFWRTAGRHAGETGLHTSRGERVCYDLSTDRLLAVSADGTERELRLPPGLAPHSVEGEGLGLYEIDTSPAGGVAPAGVYDVTREHTYPVRSPEWLRVRQGKWVIAKASGDGTSISVFTLDPETGEQHRIEPGLPPPPPQRRLLPNGSLLLDPDLGDLPTVFDPEDHSIRPLDLGIRGRLRYLTDHGLTDSGRLPLAVCESTPSGEPHTRVLLIDDKLDYVETARVPWFFRLIHVTDTDAFVVVDGRIERLRFDGETREVLWPLDHPQH